MDKKLLLHDLLRQDQEPFFLSTYISEKRIQLNKHHQFPNPKSQFQLHRFQSQLHLSQKPKFPIQFSKRSCLNLPDVKNSPLYEFHSPANNPGKNSNSVLFCIPARTANLLLEASSRISIQQKKQSKNLSKLGLFGSVLNKLRKKNGNPKSETVEDEVIKVKELIDIELAVSSSSCRSPSFGFALETGSVSDVDTPEFPSPVSSPSRQDNEKNANHGDENESELDSNVQVHEEEKEHFSPVSVLDPPLEDDDETHSEEHNKDDDDDDDDDDDEESSNRSYECSYAFVQRAKEQLLQKLRRFELLAELDPIDLEKRLLDDADQEESETENCEHGPYQSKNEWIIREVLNRQRSKNTRCMISSTDMKKLVSDLVLEEKVGRDTGIEVVKRVSKRLESLKQVESNKIDIMVEFEFRKEVDGWKSDDQEEFSAVGIDFEFDILQQLVDELLDELIISF